MPLNITRKQATLLLCSLGQLLLISKQQTEMHLLRGNLTRTPTMIGTELKKVDRMWNPFLDQVIQDL
ncbi:hypothetical protein IMY05_001G0274100 [Salix suchowensis]|nr:hypothetical protein IMY05_001G0274100 [Salix suchowensis]